MPETASVANAGTPDAELAVILVRRGATAEASRRLHAQCGVALPAVGRWSAGGGMTALWCGPDRFLAVREGKGRGLSGTLASVLDGVAHVAEASSSRAIFTVAGDDAAAALSAVLPIDLHPRAFPVGSVALTVAGHIDVMVWREERCFRVACASSFAASLRDHLN